VRQQRARCADLHVIRMRGDGQHPIPDCRARRPALSGARGDLVPEHVRGHGLGQEVTLVIDQQHPLGILVDSVVYNRYIALV